MDLKNQWDLLLKYEDKSLQHCIKAIADEVGKSRSVHLMKFSAINLRLSKPTNVICNKSKTTQINKMTKILQIFLISIFLSSCAQKTEQYCDDAFVRANNYTLNSDFVNAKKEFEKSIMENPKNANSYYGLGFMYTNEGKYEKAIEYLTQSININKNFTLAYLGRANNYYILGNLKQAESDLLKIVELKPELSSTYVMLANIESQNSNYGRAIEYINKAITLEPNNSGSYFSKGVWLGYNNEFEKGIQNLSKSIEMNPKNGLAYIYRGTFKLQFGNRDGACSDFNKAKNIGFKAETYIQTNCK